MKFLALLIIMTSFFNLSCASLGTHYEIPPYKEFQLPNGLRVLLIQDKKLPYFSVQMLVEAGSVDDEAGKEGVTSLVAELLDKGTVKRNASQIAKDLGQLGISFSASSSEEYTILSASGLSLYAEQIFSNFSEILLEPSFKDAEVWRQQKQVIASIKQLPDDPDGLADLAIERQLYPMHPYGRMTMGNLKSVTRIKRKDIIKSYLKHYRPNLATLAVVGDYPENIKEIVTKAFSDWKSKEKEEISLPPFVKVEGQDLLLVDKANTQQTQIRIAHHGITRTDPDFVKLRVAATILGGGFSSRLMEEVRVKRGLTYGISSDFIARKERGPFLISTFTRHDKVKEAVDSTIAVLTEFANKGVTSEELAQAKGYLKGVFPMAIETSEKLAYNILLLDYYKVDRSYLKNYLSELDSISVSDLNKAIKKHLHPSNLKITLMSTESKIKDQLKGRQYTKINFNKLLY